MTVSEGRWSCPNRLCRTTVTIYASEADTRTALDAIMRRHSTAHREAAVVVARMNFPNPLRPAKRRPDTGRGKWSA